MDITDMNLPGQVSIREVSPRDGFQSIDTFIPTTDKLDIIAAIAEAGVTRMETTSFTNPQAIPQLKDAADVMAGVSRPDISKYRMTHAALVPNAKGAGHAVAAGADQLVVVISATNAHNQANVRRTIDASLADLDEIFTLSRQHNVAVIGAVAVAFGCPFQGDVALADVFRIARSYVDRGAISVMLADTTGLATPVRAATMVNAFKKEFADTELILHFHNNRGTAMANLLAALMAGARTFDTALGGIGGCPNVPLAAGNLATEDVVYMLEDMGVSTGIHLPKIIDAAHLLEKRLGYSLPGQVMKSGPAPHVYTE